MRARSKEETEVSRMVGQNVHLRRRAMGMSIAELSRRTGIPRSSLHGMERGQCYHSTTPRVVTADQLVALAAALECSVIRLLGLGPREGERG